MQTLRCKCGKAIIYTSMGVQDCMGCKKCKTTYAGHPDNHKELQPHTWETIYNQQTGKPYNTCSKCGTLDEESYNLSKIK